MASAPFAGEAIRRFGESSPGRWTPHRCDSQGSRSRTPHLPIGFCGPESNTPPSREKERRQAPKIGRNSSIWRRREDADGHLVGPGVEMPPELARDLLIVAPRHHGIEEAVATRRG